MADLRVLSRNTNPPKPLGFAVVEEGKEIAVFSYAVFSYEEVKQALEYYGAMERTWDNWRRGL